MSLWIKDATFHGRLYYALRLYLHRRRWLLRSAQVLRAYIVLGPLREPFVRYCRTFRRNERLQTDEYDLFPDADPDQLVTQINESGYACIGNIAEELLAAILEYCSAHKKLRYWNPHTECEAVNRICRNVKVVEIVRRYLGAEPILWLTQLKWSLPPLDDATDLHQPNTEPAEYDDHAFHYDAIDFKSLTLFVYLTDISENAGAHIVIKGTHKNKTLKELRKIILEDDVAREAFAGRIQVISGKKGTAFLEETSGYHKVEVCKNRRLLLSADYVLRRKAPPNVHSGGTRQTIPRIQPRHFIFI